MRLFVACTSGKIFFEYSNERGAACGTNGTEFVQRCGRKTLWNETHELSTDGWEDKVEMGL
jgi:hypothetical protein